MINHLVYKKYTYIIGINYKHDGKGIKKKGYYTNI